MIKDGDRVRLTHLEHPDDPAWDGLTIGMEGTVDDPWVTSSLYRVVFDGVVSNPVIWCEETPGFIMSVLEVDKINE